MPEGPEVRLQAVQLNACLQNCQILNIQIPSSSRYHKSGLPNLSRLQFPLTIQRIYSHGKKILFQLTNDIYFVNSLSMSGHWTHQNSRHISIHLSCRNIQNFEMYFEDQRHFGQFEIVFGLKELTKRLKSIGPDLLEDTIDLTHFKSQLSKGTGKRQICQALMDQSCVSGIGNYLKAEILYHSKIRPDRIINTLTEEEWTHLHRFSLQIIRKAYSSQGNTIQNYRDIDGNSGHFQCIVYGCDKDPSGNTVIRQTFKDKRTTHWVPQVQI